MKNLLLIILLIPLFVSAEQKTQPVVGRKYAQPGTGAEAASKYFQKRSEDNLGSDDHFLALHAGKLMSGEAWEWGQKELLKDSGGMSLGVTYRIEEVSNSMDYDLRIDFNEYQILGERPYKMSVLPMIVFPEASSRFPLYFGVGAGVGVFFRQTTGESPISFDYQLVTGARFFNVYENTGFFFETGLKNHLHVLNSGQFNGTFLALGSVFTF